MRKTLSILCILSLAIATISYCAEEPDQSPKAATVTTTAKKPMLPQVDRNFVFILGSISKVDTSDPNNTKIEVMNEADNKNHVIEIGPATNVLKVIDAADLKTGEKVRVMARKADDKEVALSVVTGKIKMAPRPKPVSEPVAAPAQEIKQEQKTKK